MAKSVESPPVLDDRSPYRVAMAVVRTIAQNSPDLDGIGSVMRSLIEWKGQESREYVEAMARTGHPIFYHHLQELYAFGKERIRPEVRQDLCFLSGRHFTDSFFAENLYPLLKVALARPARFRTTLVAMLSRYLHRYGGEKYILSDEASDGELVLRVEYRRPELVKQYLTQFGLDPDLCFKNSFQFIAGAIEGVVLRIIADYEPSSFRHEVNGQRGRIHLSLKKSDHLDYQSLIQILVSHIQHLEERQKAYVEENQLEHGLVIDSPVMRDTWDRIRRASQTEEIVLLRGESGTGKSFLARRVHELSGRCDQPFIEVGLTSDIGSDNMIQSNLFGHERGAFTGAVEQKQGLFSLANGGTIFLDEIGDASGELQAKLLRVIEASTFRRLGGLKDIRVNVRVIVATNRDLEKMIKEGSFREDLYYRLNVIPIRMPPLRDRPEEIPTLAEFLLARASTQGNVSRKRLGPELATRLRGHSWPGNIRELDHALKYAMAMARGDEITIQDFPEQIRPALESFNATAPPPPAVGQVSSSSVINVNYLRQAIRSSDLVAAQKSETRHELPAHIDHAKKIYLATLIDEFRGDLSMISLYWDRSSEKTLRNLIRSYGMINRLEEARARRKD